MTERQIWYEYIKTNVNLYFQIGLPIISPPDFYKRSATYQHRCHLYQYFTDFTMYMITLMNLIGTIMLDEILPKMASIPPLIHGIQISGRTIILRANRDFVEEYLQDLNDLLIENTKNPIDKTAPFEEIHKADFRRNRFLTILEFASITISNGVFFMPELYNTFTNSQEKHTIMVSWYPYDTTISPNLEITNVGHTITWFLINLKIAACDTFFQSLIILHTTQFKHLKHLFKKLFEEAQQNEKYDRVDFEKKFRWWIKQHQDTLRITKNLKELCSPLLFCSYIECLINMCLCAFLLTVESPWTPLQRLAAVFIVGTVFVQLFVMCRLGDALNNMATSTSYDGYVPKLFLYSEKIQKSLVMIFLRVNRQLKFSAFGLFHLTSKNYGTLVQGVFSYYMALRQFQVRHYSST